MKWGEFIKNFINKYPEARLADIYKVTFQATFGPGHLGSDIDSIRYWIDKELSEVKANCNVTMYEPLGNDSEYIWINLKKFKCKKIDSDILAKAILLSMEDKKNIELFNKRWSEIEYLIKRNELNYSVDEFINFTEKIKSDNLPVIHHSEDFIKNYDPHYRVVKLSIWKESQSKN